MKKKEKKETKQQRAEAPGPARLVWSFEPDIPTEDFFDGQDPSDPGDLQEAVDSFLFFLEERRFHTWEAVVAEEQGLPLTRQQKADLEELLDFSDGEEDRILYINESPRPSQPWHVILNRLARCLLLEPCQTFATYYDVQLDGWSRLIEALEKHGGGLSLPEGAQRPEEVVPPELRYTLWLQDCFQGAFGGLGQFPENTLAAPGGPARVTDFIEALCAHRDRVQFLRLDLATLLERLVMPERDRPLFLDAMRSQLGLRSLRDPLAPALGDVPPTTG